SDRPCARARLAYDRESRIHFTAVIPPPSTVAITATAIISRRMVNCTGARFMAVAFQGLSGKSDLYSPPSAGVRAIPGSSVARFRNTEKMPGAARSPSRVRVSRSLVDGIATRPVAVSGPLDHPLPESLVSRTGLFRLPRPRPGLASNREDAALTDLLTDE